MVVGLAGVIASIAARTEAQLKVIAADTEGRAIAARANAIREGEAPSANLTILLAGYKAYVEAFRTSDRVNEAVDFGLWAGSFAPRAD